LLNSWRKYNQNVCFFTVVFFLAFQVIADIDNDGVSEMVVAVSYFFDHE
jgi:hypothetical protein